MSIATNRDTPPRAGASIDDRLARLLDTPHLARVVPHLAPATLHQLILHRGVESCGELIASATPAQLTAVLDLDLWRHPQPGRDEQFDVERFGDWLEALADIDASVAARTAAALDRQLVILGLSRYLRVFDPGTFEPTESTDDEAIDRHNLMSSETSRDVLECEVGGYLVRARRTDAWDAILTLLAALEAEHEHCFHAVMQGCRRLSNSRPEIDGLDDLLLATDQHLYDTTMERDRRRARQGYTTPADARAFLQLARQPHHTRRTPATPAANNPIATAYFRAADGEADDEAGETPAHAPAVASHRDAPDDARGDDHVDTTIAAVTQLLIEAGVTPAEPRALLSAAADDPAAARLSLLRPLMDVVQDQNEAAYLARTRELGFLANTLLAGASIQSRPFTPREASDAAACTCNLGLEYWPVRWPATAGRGKASPVETATPPGGFLVDHDLVTAFEVGWSVLYSDVSLFVAEQLESTLSDLPCGDPDTRRGIHALRRALSKQRRAGTPWLARDAAEVLATLDMTAWIGVRGLLDECPVVPEALMAVLERRTTAVSPTAFEFIATTAQIGDVRLFVRALPRVLS
jgi:hypothetical protein